ncbi:MAG: hypothetical protein IPM39_11690 [Chloroflexi bacterium]|nr:hypothetical protein [Chloroflexota bacterium]
MGFIRIAVGQAKGRVGADAINLHVVMVATVAALFAISVQAVPTGPIPMIDAHSAGVLVVAFVTQIPEADGGRLRRGRLDVEAAVGQLVALVAAGSLVAANFTVVGPIAPAGMMSTP